VHHGHHFCRRLFIYLLAQRTCLHIAVGLNNVHGPVTAKWKFGFGFSFGFDFG